MITVPQAVKKIIERSHYLSEAMSKNLINLSSLARNIKQEVEEIIMKETTESSIIMALKRLENDIKPQSQLRVFTSPPEMIVRSNLSEITVANSDGLGKKLSAVFALYQRQQKYFFTVTEGVSETTIISSQGLEEKIQHLLQDEKIIVILHNLSSITIRFPKEVIETPGIFYFLLKSLSWEAINVLEVVSTYLEFTIILQDKDINRAFAILKSLFQT